MTGDAGVGRAADSHAPELTLTDLLAVPEFRLTCIAGADALGRAVRWVHTTELLDPAQYLRGHELVCTVGTSFDDDEACARFVDAVAGADGSGICFGVGDVHEAVPTGLVEACRRAGLPLLAAPLGVPFMALSEYLVQSRVRAESDAGERGARLLVDLLARVRMQAPTAELLELAVSRLGGRLVLSEGARVLESNGRADADDDSLATVVASSPDGATLTWTGPGTEPSATLVASLAHVLDVARHERDVEADLHRERIGQLLTLVADRLASPSALTETLADAGLPAAGLVFSVWPPGASRVLVSSLVGIPVVFGETPSATVVITASADQVRSAAEQLGVVCGLSRSVPLADSARGLGEARAAFEMARRDGGCVGPEGLTSLAGLLEQQPPDRLRPFVDQLLGPLLASDARRGTAYVPTLSTYLRCDGSLTATARAEFLHVNTVRHRLARVRQLTGRDPFAFDDRVALAIALWAYQNLDSRRG